MDRRGGCCIARYASGGGGYDMSKMDRIMLRFRPIAPKPAASGSASGGSAADNGEVCPRSGRGKRRYVRDGGSSSSKRRSNRKRKASSSEETDPLHKTSSGGSVSGGGTAVVTLPLLPETPDRKEHPAGESPSEHSDLKSAKKTANKAPIWLNFSESDNRGCSGVGHVSAVLDRTLVMSLPPVGLLVTVECVTDTWEDGFGMGFSDEERIMKLGMDTCPGFISEGFNRVGWTNGALRKMMMEEEEEEEEEEGGGEVVVWLVVKERVPITCPAFTCRVRLQYTCGKRSSLTLPCDVWKMDGGGFAWRLDVKAALCLGR